MYFHVMNRGARRLSIFADDQDRERFMDLLGALAMKYHVDIQSWCLMPNHYHLLVFTDGTTLYLMIRDLDRMHALSFNARHETAGCLFQGPFRSTVPGDGALLAHVSRYIHANSLELGVEPADYRWSSCGMYLGLASRPPWANPDPVRRLVIRNGETSEDAYRQYMSEVIRKPKGKRTDDEFENLHLEIVRYLEEGISEKVLTLRSQKERISVPALVCWSAVESHGVPCHVLTEYFGYANDDCVFSIVSRCRQLMKRKPALQAQIATV